MSGYELPADTHTGDRSLAILGYHKVGAPSTGAWETWFYVPEATFWNQLSFLRDNGWQVIDLATLVRSLAGPAELPERAALITFDDGYRSVLEVALPCLRWFGYPAVQFVPTNFIGGRNWFDGGGEPEEPICDWDELRELERSGVSVQAHSASHRHFSELRPAELEQELRQSKVALEDGLGRPVEVFAFPYGDDGVDPQATGRALRRLGYRAACLYKGGPNRVPIANPYRLTRLAMGPDTDLRAELGQREKGAFAR
jgi:peptidoglycan/xylan/chitin deacetylase (PgdA/CDA1 family)